jgi:hypothetical protein
MFRQSIEVAVEPGVQFDPTQYYTHRLEWDPAVRCQVDRIRWRPEVGVGTPPDRGDDSDRSAVVGRRVHRP